MDFKCDFTPGNWSQDDFLITRSPRWEYSSSWVQKDDCITNSLPADMSCEDARTSRIGETYISMLYKQPLCGSIHVETTCSFAYRMAPLIVLSKELTPVLHEHLEIVVFDRGINLWHHFFHDGVPSWKLIAYQDLNLKANKKHLLAVELRFSDRGPFIFMGIDKPQFGCRLADDWGQECYAGITACEGSNNFYSFAAGNLILPEGCNERD